MAQAMLGGKVVRHRCGFLLRTMVVGTVGERVVVEYRRAGEGTQTLPLYHCPRCGKALRLWWREA